MKHIFFALFVYLVVCCSATLRTFEVVSVCGECQIQEDTSYHLVSDSPVVPDYDIWFKETAEAVHGALALHGYYEAPEGVDPDVVVRLSYGINGTAMETRRVIQTRWELMDGRAMPVIYEAQVPDEKNRVVMHVVARRYGSTELEALWAVHISTKLEGDNLRFHRRDFIHLLSLYIKQQSLGLTQVKL